MEDKEILNFVMPYTLLSKERIQNVLNCIDTLEKNKIQGDLIEIGVFKGGVIMAMALKCKQLKSDRKIYAFDTFSGMTTPSDFDVNHQGSNAKDCIDQPNVLCSSSLEDTKANIEKTEYTNIEYVVGDIVQTDISKIPDAIALLRLDTDWYESTKFELTHFEPSVTQGGFIIIDDYGHWNGCRKAVDEFLEKKSQHIQKIDYTGIYWQKT